MKKLSTILASTSLLALLVAPNVHADTKYPNTKWDGKNETLVNMNYSVKKYPENVVTLNDNKTKLSKQDKQKLASKGSNKYWAEYKKLDKLGRGQSVQGLVTYQSLTKSRAQKRPSFSSSTHVAGEFTNTRFDRTKQTWIPTKTSTRNNAEITSNGYHGWLYNKSHSLAYSLGGDMETHNLTLGTRAQNVGTNKASNGGGMGYAETKIRKTLDKHHNAKILYKVEPLYKGKELLPRGSHVTAYSVNDNGKTINLNTYVFNAQDNIKLNYKNGTWEYKDKSKARQNDVTSSDDLKKNDSQIADKKNDNIQDTKDTKSDESSYNKETHDDKTNQQSFWKKVKSFLNNLLH